MGDNVVESIGVNSALVGVQPGLTSHVAAHDLVDGGLVGVLDVEAANLAATLDERNDGALLAGSDLPALGGRRQVLVAGLNLVGLPEVGLIRLDDAIGAAHGWQLAATHRLADAVRQE